MNLAMRMYYLKMALIAFSFAAPAVICKQKNQPSSSIKEWCAKTYNPKPCENFLTNDPNYASVEIKGKADFIKISLQLAYDRAVNASKAASALGPNTKNQKERAAWSECVDLYKKNVVILNQTIHHIYNCSPDGAELDSNEKDGRGDSPHTKCTAFDVLANTLNNIDDCEDRFLDIDMTHNVWASIRDNVLEDLVVNVLALNEKKSPRVAGAKHTLVAQNVTWEESAEVGSNIDDVGEGEEDEVELHSDYPQPHSHPPHHN